jgi:hypothetical protein
MPETPDFKGIAVRVVNLVDAKVPEPFIPIEDGQVFDTVVASVAEQLRQVWTPAAPRMGKRRSRN